MVDRNLFESAHSSFAGTQATPDLTGAQLLEMVGNGLNKMGEAQIAEWQKATVENAAKEGAIAGSEGPPKYQDASKLSGQAFNEAAAKSHVTNLEINASAMMAKLQQEYSSDPEGYKKQSTSYINGLTEELNSNRETKALGGLFEARLKLAQQSGGYQVSKNYMAAQADKMKADTETLYHTIKTNSYREAGGVFSKDPSEQAISLNNFALSKKVLDTQLHAVTPDGKPLYTEQAIQRKEQEFHSKFYTRAVQDYVSEADIDENTLLAIKDGNLTVDFQGQQINILNEVGAEKYETEVRDFTFTKIREQNAAIKKAEAEEKAASKEAQYVNGFDLISGIFNGAPQTAAGISQKLKTGQINHADAMAAMKMISDPQSGQTDSMVEAELEMRIINGHDASSDIKAMANKLNGNAYKRLMVLNTKEQQGEWDANRKELMKEAIKPDAFGFPDPKSQRLAADIGKRYDRMIETGMDPSLAYEKSRQDIDMIKKNDGTYNSIPLYNQISETGEMDVQATMLKTMEARKAGFITEAQYDVERNRLKRIFQGE